MVNTQRLKVYGLLVGVFLLGSVAGAAASYAISQRDIEDVASGKREPFERRRIQALAAELDLSSEQEARIKAIFRKHREERRRITREMHERCGDPLRHHRARLDAEMRSVLTAEQRPRFDELAREHQNRFGGPFRPSQ